MQRPLLLLHGAIGASDQLQNLANELAGTHDVHLFDFPGHGGTAMPEQPFSIPLFATAVLNFVEKKGWTEVDIVGYSMGGYVALYLAKYYPEAVGRIVTLATKFHWDEAIAAKEVRMLHPPTIQAKVPAFAATLAQRHMPGNWEEVLCRTADMMQQLGQAPALTIDDCKEIDKEVLLLLGDRDTMVTIDETLAVYQSLPNARLGMIPDTPHPIERVDAVWLAYFVHWFLK